MFVINVYIIISIVSIAKRDLNNVQNWVIIDRASCQISKDTTLSSFGGKESPMSV